MESTECLRPDVDEYLGAAARKVAIAGHELQHLESALAEVLGPNSPMDEPKIEAPIPVQAYFEGVLYAFDAAADQLAEALQLGRPSAAGALPAVADCVNQVQAWLLDPIVRETSLVRNDATHAYYHKRPNDGLWQVALHEAIRRDGTATF